MKHPQKILIFALVFTALSLGCSKSSSDNASSVVTTNFSITGSGQPTVVQNSFKKVFSYALPSAMALPPPILVDSTGQGLTLDVAWLVFQKIQFKSSEVAEADESTDANIKYSGPFFVDLLSVTPEPFGNIELPASELRRVKMLLHKSKNIPESLGAPTELDGNSVYFEVSLDDGRSFTFASDDTTNFEISGPRAFIPEDGKSMLTVIRVADLFKKIKLSGLSSGNTNISSSNRVSTANPCPLIHAQATNIYTCFIKGIASEAKFGKDNGGDYDLDSSDETVE